MLRNEVPYRLSNDPKMSEMPFDASVFSSSGQLCANE